jgi:hypothetical protein
VVGGVALYIRFVKGWRFSDLMYVTRSSLSSMTETMKSGETPGFNSGGRAGMFAHRGQCSSCWGRLGAKTQQWPWDHEEVRGAHSQRLYVVHVTW